VDGHLTITFDSYNTAVIAHTLLYGVFQAIGHFTGKELMVTKPEPDHKSEPDAGPFVVKIWGES
jgi:hypothetical protein